MQALNAGQLLSAKSRELLFTPGHLKDGTVSGFPHTGGYAMGWNVMKKPWGEVYMNDGGQQETRTFMINVPQKNFIMAFAINLESENYDEILFPLYELVMGEKLVQ